MKKLYLPLLFVCLVSLGARAQATYQSTNYANVGDSFLVSNASLDSINQMDFTTYGTNVNWSYTNLSPKSQSEDRFLNPNSTGYRVSFLSACVLAGGGTASCNNQWTALTNIAHASPDSFSISTFSFSNLVNHEKKTTASLVNNIIGFSLGINGVNLPFTVTYQAPDTIFRFPLIYGNRDSCTSNYNFDLNSLGVNLIYQSTTKRVNEVEGYGSLVTPYHSFASVIKLKTTLTNYDTVVYAGTLVPLPVTQTVSYSWFDPNYKREVLKTSGTVVSGIYVASNVEYLDTIRCISPMASFSKTPAIPYLNTSTNTVDIEFDNHSQNASTFTWDFGDPNSGTANGSTSANPTHTYSAAGTYQVSLVACNSICSPMRCDTTTQPVVVLDSSQILADFTYTPLQPCAGDTVHFTNNSLNSLTSQWFFGDGGTSNLRNPRHIYTIAGTYTIQLIVSGSLGSDTTTQQITVSALASAQITPSGPTSICQGDSVILTASGGNFYSWSNGSVSTSITVKNTGTYSVTVINDCGSATASTTVTVNHTVPTLSLTASENNICPGTVVTFTANTTNGGSSPYYQWKLNGTTVGGNSATYTSSSNLQNGDQITCLFVSNAACASPDTLRDTINMLVNASVAPSVGITANPAGAICPNTAVTFTAHPLGGGSTPTLQWKLNGNNVGAGITYSNNTLSNGDVVKVLLTSSAGCASPDTASNSYTITVLPVATTSDTQRICQGQSYGGHNATGTYIDTFAATNSCDSIRTLHLTVVLPATSTVTQAICQGQRFEGYTVTGTYVDTFTAANTCDSIRTLHLTVTPPVTSTVTQTVCQGQSFEGYNITGTYVDTFVAANTCDSIRTLNLTVIAPITTIDSATICHGQSFMGYTISGMYVDTFAAANGCDSIHTLLLNVLPFDSTSISQTICFGQQYDRYSSTGTFVDSFTNAQGCDSVRTLYLTVLPLTTDSVAAAICTGDSYQGHNVSGVYTDTLTNSTGCDSISILVLTVNPLPDVPTISQSNNTLTASAALHYQWYMDSITLAGDSSQQLVITQSGNYTVYVTDSNGCSNRSAIYNALYTGIKPIDGAIDFSIYPNPSYGMVYLQYAPVANTSIVVTDVLGKIWLQQTDVRQIDISQLAQGMYYIRLQQAGQYSIKPLMKQ